jgi:hypothetical protein
MKCCKCEEEKILFTVMPKVSKDIAWGSHVLVEGENGTVGLAHYECGNVNMFPIHDMFLEMINESNTK